MTRNEHMYSRNTDSKLDLCEICGELATHHWHRGVRVLEGQKIPTYDQLLTAMEKIANYRIQPIRRNQYAGSGGYEAPDWVQTGKEMGDIALEVLGKPKAKR